MHRLWQEDQEWSAHSNHAKGQDLPGSQGVSLKDLWPRVSKLGSLQNQWEKNPPKIFSLATIEFQLEEGKWIGKKGSERADLNRRPLGPELPSPPHASIPEVTEIKRYFCIFPLTTFPFKSKIHNKRKYWENINMNLVTSKKLVRKFQTQEA